MPEGGVVVLYVALAVGGAYYGGKAAYKHVLKPAGCAVAKVATLGHHHCKKPAPQPATAPQAQPQPEK